MGLFHPEISVYLLDPILQQLIETHFVWVGCVFLFRWKNASNWLILFDRGVHALMGFSEARVIRPPISELQRVEQQIGYI